jgi:hypothetical protein
MDFMESIIFWQAMAHCVHASAHIAHCGLESACILHSSAQAVHIITQACIIAIMAFMS